MLLLRMYMPAIDRSLFDCRYLLGRLARLPTGVEPPSLQVSLTYLWSINRCACISIVNLQIVLQALGCRLTLESGVLGNDEALRRASMYGMAAAGEASVSGLVGILEYGTSSLNARASAW